MKKIMSVMLTALSALILFFSAASHADNTDSDAFVAFEAQTTEVSQIADLEATANQTVSVVPATKVQNMATQDSVVQAVAQDELAARQEVVQIKRVTKPAIKPEIKKAVVKQVKKKSQKRAKRAERKQRNTRAQQARMLKRSKFYRIRRGDTLYRISVKSGISLNRLVRLNKLYGKKKHNIQAGQTIRLR